MLVCFSLLVLHAAIMVEARIQNLSMDLTSNCSMRHMQMKIKVENCLPVRLHARACGGTCASYTTTSSSNPHKLETRCECCQYIGRKRKVFGIKCPYKNIYKLAVGSITLPKRCMCRPCSSTPNQFFSAEKSILLRNPMLDLLRTNLFYR